ncbi:MAG TPA: CHASE sensor domain-containing protein [Kiritimatiellia bacterium]|nr:CHASE sensor domain-containing protein [Kiritimatiellia bacterium]
MLILYGIALLIFVVAGVAVISAWARLAEQKQELASTADLLGYNVSAALLFGDEVSAKELLGSLYLKPYAVYARVCTVDHVELATWSRLSGEGKVEVPHRHEGGALFIQTLRYTLRYAPLELDGEPIGWMLLVYSMSGVYERMLRVLAGLLVLAMLGLMASLGYSRKLSRQVTGPVLRLTEFVDSMRSCTELTRRAEVESDDEVGGLAGGINTMLDHLETSGRELAESLVFQRTLLDAIPMPVYYTDGERRLLGANEPFCRLMARWSERELLGKRMHELNWSDQATVEALAYRDEELLAGSSPASVLHYERQVCLEDGRVYAIQFVKTMYTQGKGGGCGVIGVLNDVTELRRMEKELVDATVQEQQRIARDLHDDLGQLLTAAAYKARLIVLALGSSGKAMASQVEDVIQLIQQSAKKTRDIARGLNPLELEDADGLPEALRQLAERTLNHCEIPVVVHGERGLPKVHEFAATNLFRIAQEAINNAVKHADPGRIDVSLFTEDHHLILQVKDNGRKGGEDAAVRSGPGGMGLRIMRYRAHLLQGEFSSEPGRDCGTIVTCRVPLTAISGSDGIIEEGASDANG